MLCLWPWPACDMRGYTVRVSHRPYVTTVTTYSHHRRVLNRLTTPRSPLSSRAVCQFPSSDCSVSPDPAWNWTSRRFAPLSPITPLSASKYSSRLG